MIMLLLLMAVAAIAVSYFWHQKKNTPIDNRYRKNTKKITPTLTDSHPEPVIDDDAVLGLKKTTPLQPESESLASSNPSTEKTPPIVLYLMAPEGALYGGYELLQALLSAGLRYGQHHIFHRHEHKDGHGETLFHCASAEKPGTFDPSHMGNFTTPGLCFFFSIDNNHDPLSTFDLLLDTLDQLVEDLGGLVQDNQHQLFTKETMIKYRQRIRGIENRHATADLFAEI